MKVVFELVVLFFKMAAVNEKRPSSRVVRTDQLV